MVRGKREGGKRKQSSVTTRVVHETKKKPTDDALRSHCISLTHIPTRSSNIPTLSDLFAQFSASPTRLNFSSIPVIPISPEPLLALP
ncbi:hypothetical protein Pmani_029830 [Petrolisthes manimaculis]|uniref:Uncharacterized protein n=1 Tax=Petrolisthes manimaculis TaxID=1843537 RepID=A0AAE1TWK5_9EUCA|nr:hypothetical protein Pmani_029830 [Petrolisthes manimaculis]